MYRNQDMSDPEKSHNPAIIPPEDPNRGKNRVPSQFELQEISKLRTRNRQSTADIAKELEIARDERDRLHDRYQRQVLELEGIKSALSLACDSIDGLERRERELQEKDEGLRAIAHPMRRCPDEIFRLIFQLSVELDPSAQMKIATKLSHVCQSWRAIAISTTTLRTAIEVAMDEDMDDVRSFLDRSLQRLRTTPPNITIKRSKRRSEAHNPPALLFRTLLKACQLERFAFIQTMFLEISTDDLEFRSYSLCKRRIGRIVVGSSSLGGKTNAWQIESLLHAFPKAENLVFEVSERQCVIIDPLESALLPEDYSTFPTVQTLEIKGCESYLSPGLSLLTSLVKLNLFMVRFQPIDEPVNMSQLRELSVTYGSQMQWNMLTAPVLETLHFIYQPAECIDFACRHPTIKHLDIQIKAKEEFNRLIVALPDLESVKIFDSLREGVNWAEMRGASKIIGLILDLTRGFWSAEEIERRIQWACHVPQSHDASRPKSLDLPRIYVLESLDIRDPNPLEWETIPSLADCTITRGPAEYYHMEYNNGSVDMLELTWLK